MWLEWAIHEISQKYILGVAFSEISLKTPPVNQIYF